MEKTFAIIVSLIAIASVVLPFFIGQGGLLAAAATEDDPKVLEEAKLRIAKRWSKDEAAFLRKEISNREWEMRKELLTNRFLDTARRLDHIRGEK
jgi:hypothetical protein